MPDLTTHFLFGESILTHLPEDLKQLITAHKNLFHYALQGPDMFFFHKVLTGPFVGMSNLPRCGRIMHRFRIKETFEFMQNYMLQKQDCELERDILRVYYLGYLGHYFLDKTVHPYVYFLTESVCKQHPKRTQRSIHARIESEFDFYFYQKFYEKPVASFPVREYFDVDGLTKNIIAKMIVQLLEDVYQEVTEVGEVMRCFDDMKNISSLLYDSSGILSSITTGLGAVFPKTLDLTYQVKPVRVSGDALNLKHRQWNHPLNPENKSRKSVPELFETAEKSILPVYLQTWQSWQSPMAELSPLPFDTSLDFSGNLIGAKDKLSAD